MTSRTQTPFSIGSPWLLAALLAASGAASANEALARKHGCLGCHAIASPMVGPAYRQVAEKYGSDKAALSTLAQNIRSGSSGRWGEIGMPPQPQVSSPDAKRLASWILGGAK